MFTGRWDAWFNNNVSALEKYAELALKI